MERKGGEKRAPRIRVPGGSALCTAAGRSAQLEVVDASTSGLALAGSPLWSPQDVIDVVAWWPGIGEVELRARLARVDTARDLFALHFLEADPIVHLLLEELANVQRYRDLSPAILIYGRDERFQARMTQTVAALGMRALVTHTPLEAMWPLQDCRERVAAVIVDASLGGLQLAGMLAEEIPDVPRVLAADRPLSSTRELCESGVVGAVLDLGASPETLLSIIGAVDMRQCLSCDNKVLGDATFCASCIDWSRRAADEYEELGVGD